MRVQTLDRKLRTERDTRTVLEREAARLHAEVEAHTQRVTRAQLVRPPTVHVLLRHTLHA